MKRILMALSFFLFFSAVPAVAENINFQPGMTQELFKDLSKDLGGIMIYRAVAPATPLGLTGFDIGVEVTLTDVNTGKDYWKKAFKNQDAPAFLLMPKLHVQKGLPFGIDLGLVYSQLPGTDIKYLGGEVKYAILDGGAVWPAVAVRGSYTQIFGVDQLDFKTYGLEVTASKGFGTGIKITPYASLGEYWGSSDPKNLPAGIALSGESFAMTRFAAGAKLQILMFAVTAEADYVRVPSYTLRVGVTW